jgi:large subunit ribosomal protein L21
LTGARQLRHARLRRFRRPRRVPMSEESESAVYAIVRAGGRQEKVAVGDVLEIDRVDAEPGASVQLPVLLLVDGEKVTSDKAALAKAIVTVEVVAATKGPKIEILKYKNKTGYRKRQGHRQRLTQVKVVEVSAKSRSVGKKAAADESSNESASTESASTASA